MTGSKIKVIEELKLPKSGLRSMNKLRNQAFYPNKKAIPAVAGMALIISSVFVLSLFVKFAGRKLLLVDRFQYFTPAFYRRFGIRLARPQLNKHFGLFKFFLVLFERFVDIFAIF